MLKYEKILSCVQIWDFNSKESQMVTKNTLYILNVQALHAKSVIPIKNEEKITLKTGKNVISSVRRNTTFYLANAMFVPLLKKIHDH